MIRFFKTLAAAAVINFAILQPEARAKLFEIETDAKGE